MFDVFYFGPKPNLFAFERPAASLAEAQSLSRTRYCWYIYGGNDYTGFNFDFVPAPWESHYTHVWADQHQQDGNVYLTSDANANRLYHSEAVHRLGDLKCWFVPSYIDPETVDYKWSPDPQSPPYIYHFPSQWQSASGVTYTVPGATEIKLVSDFTVRAVPRHSKWEIPGIIDITSMDLSWHPNVLDPATNYHFPVQWNWDNIGGPVYRMPGAIDNKYIADFVAKTQVDMANWIVPANINKDTFDFSWQPHPADPPYIYKFPTAWNNEGGPEYHVPGATQEKYMSELVAETIIDMSCWSVPEEVNANEVDFSWVPHPKDPPYIYHFGTDFQQSVGLTYTVPGATEIKFAGPIPVKGKQTALEVLDIFFVDHGNDTATTRYELLNEQHNVQKVRYANSMIDTIKRCANRSTTNKFWVISSEYDYTDFNFAWHPAPWQNYMTHVFPSQHQKWSNTFLINRAEFERNINWAKTLEEFPNLNFVSDQQVYKPNPTCTIYYVDHGNPDSKFQYKHLQGDAITNTDVVLTRFVDNYLDTFKRIVNTARTEYVWIINSICDYSRFDFSWEPEPWQKEMIHVFPSGTQDRGDTFYIHVESFKKQMIELELLDWFNVINYCSDQIVDRFPEDVVHYNHDNLVEEVRKHKFETPYTMFTNHENLSMVGSPCLWTEKDRTIQRVSPSGATAMVPRDIKKYLKDQLYDYPYIELSPYRVADQTSLDIVYISNGEPDAEKWFERLRYQLFYSNSRTPNDVSRLKRVQNVNGRAAAYQNAAKISNTPWFFAVFAKLEIDENFDWFWQPDYFQEPKHYIFNARNPVNGLEYGHQAMIAYNKELVLSNNNPGIDFTLSQPHESVPLLSGTAHFNQSEWMTWRTAFREVLKLKLFQETSPSLENEYRLNTWLTKAQGNFSEWSIKGAEDAVAYYNEVQGELVKLQLSFEWTWLQERFNARI